jgi:hypothetical protein
VLPLRRRFLFLCLLELLCSAKCNCPDDDEDVEEDQRYCGIHRVSLLLFTCPVVLEYGRHSLRISVRTEFMRLIVFALTLAPSCAPPPKEGSFCAALPQPTVL